MYSKVIKLYYQTPTAVTKYMMLFPCLNEVENKNMFIVSRCCTSDNKMKEFQYKILHRFLATNSLLFRMNKIESDKCTFCGIYKENISHLFYDCVYVKNLWLAIKNIIFCITGKQIILNCKAILLGYDLESYKEAMYINTIILNVKYFIWHSKSKYFMSPSLVGLRDWLSKRVQYDRSLETLYNVISMGSLNNDVS